ncbi:S-adenosyl-L-methionine-dependent methyltransferase [Aspergillus steynii IBT 23096]|uniref:S-adenosyl-L-methionine-dependent methyltransferase n=1 Tax=Aspergillus steynii IBT 23096 TaxID=1392250 RepID=A0A2I2GPV3_9EURO|nr:S-adenosyl-L-methionine-dependent methyltransferase [Aspergillus steynii IBT 23096]PLB54905.1 S-adenosyl-L-methionine-dependent methyltransferase [Aspergillus steynii IBT 23096]
MACRIKHLAAGARGLLSSKSLLSPRPYSLQKMAHSTSAGGDWSASQYLKFEDERTRPARDLLSRVALQNPKNIVDLGCGPGNSTAILQERYPAAQIVGIDSSPNMIKKARSTLPERQFTVQGLQSYSPSETVDLFYSNALFQWIKGDERFEIMKRLIRSQESGGTFAFQVPYNLSEPSHVLMRETANKGPWASALSDVDRDEIQSPQEIYDNLKPLCSDVQIFKTDYFHPLADHQAVIEWVKDQEAYLAVYLESLEKAYPKFSMNRRIPKDLKELQSMKVIWNQTVLIIFLVNDIASFRKELRSDCLHNFIPVAYSASRNLQSAIHDAVDLIQKSVKTFDRAAEDLQANAKARGYTEDDVGWFIQLCRY